MYVGYCTAPNSTFNPEYKNNRYSILSPGPTKRLSGLYGVGAEGFAYVCYDPTNGTVSPGDIWYVNGQTTYHSFN